MMTLRQGFQFSDTNLKLGPLEHKVIVLSTGRDVRFEQRPSETYKA
jgi:hypothetical protein